MHPKTRGILLLLSLIGAFFTHSLIGLTLCWLVLLISFFLLGKKREHFYFVGLIVFPTFLLSFLIWGLWLKTVPQIVGFPDGLNPFLYSIFISIRLAVVGGIFQIFLVTIPNDELVSTFSFWGIKRENLIIVIGAFTIIHDFRKKLTQIIDARYAKGLIKRRSRWSKLKQIPYILKPLVINAFLSLIERAETWSEQNIVDKLEQLEKKPKFILKDLFLIIAAILFFIVINNWISIY